MGNGTARSVLNWFRPTNTVSTQEPFQLVEELKQFFQAWEVY